jgi:type I restriction enzyme M protein
LLFLRRLDDLQTLEENKSTRLGWPIERCVFPKGNDPRDKPYEQLRWSRFKHAEARELFTVFGEHVFQFLRTLGGDDSTYAHHMKDARFTFWHDRTDGSSSRKCTCTEVQTSGCYRSDKRSGI